MSQNITIKEIGDQFIMSDGTFLINKSKTTEYVTLITNTASPERNLLGIEENGYYLISYCDVHGIIYNRTEKPKRESNDRIDLP